MIPVQSAKIDHQGALTHQYARISHPEVLMDYFAQNGHQGALPGQYTQIDHQGALAEQCAQIGHQGVLPGQSAKIDHQGCARTPVCPSEPPWGPNGPFCPNQLPGGASGPILVCHTMYVTLRFSNVYKCHSVCHNLYVTQVTLYVTLCMSHSVCHTLYVTLCMSHSVCHTLYVTLSMSHSIFGHTGVLAPPVGQFWQAGDWRKFRLDTPQLI